MRISACTVLNSCLALLFRREARSLVIVTGITVVSGLFAMKMTLTRYFSLCKDKYACFYFFLDKVKSICYISFARPIMQSLTDSVLSSLSKPVCDCGGNCSEILSSLREALELPLKCSICKLSSKDAVVEVYGNEPLCNACALEVLS